jgi:hypothetical protein
MKKQLIEMYLDYVNNFLTVQAWAENHGIEEDDAHKIIEIGRKYCHRGEDWERIHGDNFDDLLRQLIKRGNGYHKVKLEADEWEHLKAVAEKNTITISGYMIDGYEVWTRRKNRNGSKYLSFNRNNH